MPICPNCGNTRNPPTVAQCQVCGSALSPTHSTPVTGNPGGSAKHPALIDSRGKRFNISATGETYIGNRGCAIILADPKVSPRHVRIFADQGHFFIEDLAGGVTLNGRPITGHMALNLNDDLVIGASHFRIDVPPVSSLIVRATPVQTPPLVAPINPNSQAAGTTINVSSTPPKSSITGIGGKPPILEGSVMHIDGPHMEEPDYSLGTVIAKTIGQIILFPLIWWKPGFSPLLYRNDQHKQTPARYLRVKNDQGQVCVVKMKGEIYRGMVSQGDRILVWGNWDGGTLIMDYGYNVTINSIVSLKKII